jgi:PadR family transcriptional regulator PadR
MEFNKDLIAASSTPIVLAILSEGDSYGYAIIKRVQELSGGEMEWTDGMLYPVLHRLERLGLIKARWELAESGRRRKYYRITTSGRAQLTEERKQWQAVDATLRGIWKSLSVCIEFVHHVSTAPLLVVCIAIFWPTSQFSLWNSSFPLCGSPCNFTEVHREQKELHREGSIR